MDIANAIRTGTLLRSTLRQTNRLGVTVIPYRWETTEAAPAEVSGDYRSAQFSDAAELAGIEATQGGIIDHPKVRMERGDRGFLAICDGKIAAASWGNVSSAVVYERTIPLKSNEIFLYYMFVLPQFRGMGLAPQLRQAFCSALYKEGITTVYSTVEPLNAPAVRFKDKCGAKRGRVHLYVKIGSKAWNI